MVPVSVSGMDRVTAAAEAEACAARVTAMVRQARGRLRLEDQFWPGPADGTGLESLADPDSASEPAWAADPDPGSDPDFAADSDSDPDWGCPPGSVAERAPGPATIAALAVGPGRVE